MAKLQDIKYEDALASARKLAPSMGITAEQFDTNLAKQQSISVDTLSRQADPAVDRGVEAVNRFQSRQPSNALRSDIGMTTATTAPETTPVDTNKQALADLSSEIAGTSIADARAQARDDAMVVEKEQRARTLGDRLTERQRQIQDGLETIEANPEGKTEWALNADIAKYNRESTRELADLSFSYQVALGDYQAAEKIANDYVADIQADLANKQNTWQMMYNLVQNDMTASEKLQAEQNFAEKQAQTQFSMNKQLEQYKSQLRQQESSIEAQREQAAKEAQNAMIASLFGDTTSDFAMDFDSYVAQLEEEQQMSFSPEVVDNLRTEFESQYQVPSNDIDKISGMVATGILSPQQADFLMTNMEIQTPQVRAKQEQAIRRGKTVLRDVDRALEQVDSAGKAAGFFAEEGVLGIDRLSPAYELYQHLQSIKSNISIDELQAMREASPTGGALGQVPVQQQEFLMSVLGSLTPSLEPAVLAENLNDVYNIYLDAMFGSPGELEDAVRRGQMSVGQANAYLFTRKKTSFDEYGIPAASGGQDITNIVIAPDGKLTTIK